MDLVNFEVKDRIAFITINRVEKRNALNDEVVKSLKASFSKAEQDPEVKVVVLTGAGDVFCAGADLQYLQQLQKNTFEENLKDSQNLKELFYQIYTLKKVVIAKVNGHAVAGGCGLVSVCDFSFTVPSAHFGYTEVRIGFIPAIVMVFLTRKLGEAKAREFLLSGNIYHAKDAKAAGLVNWIVEEENLDNAVMEFANNLISNNSQYSMQVTKQMFLDIQEQSLEEALDYASKMNAEVRGSEDCKKGIDAFLKKQKPNW